MYDVLVLNLYIDKVQQYVGKGRSNISERRGPICRKGEVQYVGKGRSKWDFSAQHSCPEIVFRTDSWKIVVDGKVSALQHASKM